MADPQAVERQVESTLKQLHERYRELQSRLAEINLSEKRSNQEEHSNQKTYSNQELIALSVLSALDDEPVSKRRRREKKDGDARK